ncbi:MAG: CDP-diacylglycerol--glycerol-3-phosphate 3-phosphatidyltransferase [Clostridiaceae bacterium]|nr:CDP-diacylglycerol--glycerol-3-phosphate 3-phosphatidyltransferase [Clostridiaceae bacterium]
MNLPNRLTVVRILMIPLILVFLLPLPEAAWSADWNAFILSNGRIVALFLFVLASITDLIDGRIARKYNLITNFGKFMDPIADKMLIISVLIAFVQTGRISALVAIIVIIREFMITGIRLVAADKGVVIAAGQLGKAKTVSQIVAIIIILAEPLLIWLTSSLIPAAWITVVGDGSMIVAVALTLISGYNYLRNSQSFLKD